MRTDPFAGLPVGRFARLPERANGPTGQRAKRNGQSLIEYAVLVAAVTAALIVMSDYVRRAFNAHAESIEEELNGATQ